LHNPVARFDWLVLSLIMLVLLAVGSAWLPMWLGRKHLALRED
jgi:hypothetical protein